MNQKNNNLSNPASSALDALAAAQNKGVSSSMEELLNSPNYNSSDLLEQLKKALGPGMFQHMTPEERVRLQELEVEQTKNKDLAKINAFKKLAPHLRQLIIDVNDVIVVKNTIANADAPVPDELKKLRMKSEWGTRQSNWGTDGTEVRINTSMFERIFETGIKLEDLKTAHAEALIEEQLSETTDP